MTSDNVYVLMHGEERDIEGVRVFATRELARDYANAFTIPSMRVRGGSWDLAGGPGIDFWAETNGDQWVHIEPKPVLGALIPEDSP